MEGESGVTRSESCVTRGISDELDFWDIQGDQMEGEGDATESIIDELHSSDLVKWKVKVVLLQISLMKFILGISKEIKRKVKVAFIEVSLMIFIFRISNQVKWKVEVVLLEVSLINLILLISKVIK